MLELYPKKAISKGNLPPFLTLWLDHGSSECMFSVHEMKTWTTAHLAGCGWYIECDPKFTAPSEVELRQSLQSVGAIDVVLDDYAGLEESAKQKTILKRYEEDRKKHEKLIVDVEKAAEKEAEKKLRMARKAAEKKAKKSKGKTPSIVEVPDSSVDNTSTFHAPSRVGRIHASLYSSLTEEVITYGPLPTTGEEISPHPIGELILNMTI